MEVDRIASFGGIAVAAVFGALLLFGYLHNKRRAVLFAFTTLSIAGAVISSTGTYFHRKSLPVSWAGNPVQLDNRWPLFVETPSRHYEEPFTAMGYLVKPIKRDFITLRIWKGEARDFVADDMVEIGHYWFALRCKVESVTTDAEGWPVVRLAVGPSQIGYPDSPTPNWPPATRSSPTKK